MDRLVTPKGGFLVRVDADARIGMGHLMRCLALAQGIKDHGLEAAFVMAAPDAPIKKRVESEGVELISLASEPGSLEDAAETAGHAGRREAGWVVVDGYHFGSDYQKAVKGSGKRLLFVDDYGHAKHYSADIVLNLNLGAASEKYSDRAPDTRLLLGPKFALLRREFLKWKGREVPMPEQAGKVLVSMGGGDFDNVTLKVMHALGTIKMDGLEAVVIAGEANPHKAELEAYAQRAPFKAVVETNSSRMAERMAWADIAVTGGGGTVWELSFMAVPSLLLVLAENQRQNVEKMGQLGASVNLGRHADADAKSIGAAIASVLRDKGRRSAMAAAGRGLVDGEGARRVIDTCVR